MHRGGTDPAFMVNLFRKETQSCGWYGRLVWAEVNSTAPLRDQAFIADSRADGTTEALGETNQPLTCEAMSSPHKGVNVRVMEVRPFSSPVFPAWAHFTKGHSDE